MSNLTIIKLNLNKVSKEKASRLDYNTDNVDENLFYSNLYSNILIFYSIKYTTLSNKTRTFNKYFVLSDIIGNNLDQYSILDDIDKDIILEKEGFIKYLAFKSGSLKNLFNENASNEEKEEIVASLNRVSPKNFVKIDRLAKTMLFKKIVGNQEYIENEKTRVFQSIFNIVEKNLPKLEITKYNRRNLNQQPQSQTISTIISDNSEIFSNNILDKSEIQKDKTFYKRFENIDQTLLNAILNYDYNNCNTYTSNRKLNYNSDKNKNIFYVEKIESKNRLEVEIDLDNFLTSNESYDLQVFRHINIEYYSQNYKQSNYKTYNNKALIDPEHLFIENMSNITLENKTLKVNSNKRELTCFFNKEYYSRANAIWSLKNVDNESIFDNSEFNSLTIKRIFERYVVEISYKGKRTFVCFNNTLNNPKDISRLSKNMFLEVNKKENLRPNIVIINSARRQNVFN